MSNIRSIAAFAVSLVAAYSSPAAGSPFPVNATLVDSVSASSGTVAYGTVAKTSVFNVGLSGIVDADLQNSPYSHIRLLDTSQVFMADTTVAISSIAIPVVVGHASTSNVGFTFVDTPWLDLSAPHVGPSGSANTGSSTFSLAGQKISLNQGTLTANPTPLGEAFFSTITIDLAANPVELTIQSGTGTLTIASVLLDFSFTVAGDLGDGLTFTGQYGMYSHGMVVPEPGSLVMLASGGLLMAAALWRRKRRVRVAV